MFIVFLGKPVISHRLYNQDLVIAKAPNIKGIKKTVRGNMQRIKTKAPTTNTDLTTKLIMFSVSLLILIRH